jgi:hypothetical protein
VVMVPMIHVTTLVAQNSHFFYWSDKFLYKID